MKGGVGVCCGAQGVGDVMEYSRSGSVGCLSSVDYEGLRCCAETWIKNAFETIVFWGGKII